ncbi:hypothetical protein Tsp_01647 [Trichinella spiralis]|uniref:Reverse transcriptase domain-containing protein n=1 Tax=Trichinella spiralis TaxID=6334 RepID=E5SD34_TRISP|nr:hypothetical protein Tsp_01647 [Trichinella spiralis]KRY35386.1 Uncharacterized protein T01_636 [Trichinella spiralis]
MLRILSPLKQRNTESTRQTIKRQLKPFHPLLKHFRGHTVQVLGAAFLTVEYGFFNRPLHALVVKGRRYSLLGRNWFEPLDIRLHPRYREGTTSGTPYWRISTTDTEKRPTSAIGTRVRIFEELERLVEQDILEPVQHTAWITPIVLVIKDDGSMRIYGKCTVNKALQKVLYQVSAVNDILATLKKGRIFAKLDLTRAYQQLLVDEASAELQTIITHNRAFKSWSYRMACYKAFDLLRTNFT